MELVRKLQQRQADGNPISVGIVGCGHMGSGLAHALNSIPGMAIRAVADIEPDRPLAVFREMGWDDDDIALTEDATQAEDALRAGKVVVTPDAMVLPALESLEAAVEATGLPDIGAAVARACIERRKPIVMLNVETDVTVGPYLNHLARRNGTVYTVASGDEPGVCKMLYEQAMVMGFEVVCLGKGKNNPIHFDATPESCAEEARSKDMNPKMLAAFQDGTKTMVEMAAVSNATGLLPDVRGMHGAKADLDELAATFIPREDGGILGRRGAVDFSTGRVAPGVFAVVYTDEPRMRKDMKYITGSDGPYYLHYRPYHLCDIETPQSVAEAVLLGEVTIASGALNSEVITLAKRDLRPGETVGTIGGPEIYGTICTREEARALDAIPIGLAQGGRITADVPRGEPLTSANFAPDTTTVVYGLRREQDAWLEDRA